jgi:hypothetical protein
MEYLITYGWAFLIIAIVMGALIASNAFNPGQGVSQECILQAGFNCLSAYMAENGLLTINLLQATQSTINITAIGCNEEPVLTEMEGFKPNVTMYIDANSTFTVQCYTSTGAAFSGRPGALFEGSLIVNYTDISTGFPQVIYGKIIARIS